MYDRRQWWVICVEFCMSGDGGRHFESCFSFHVYYLVERNVYKSSEFIKEFHVLRDMTMADYERRGERR